tara:strand:+ start:1545 stop:1769 length:225 start_codon:yes stop_codon:yes gene_type:complete
MDKKIIFKQDDGTISIITPTQTALNNLTIDEIAKKDVPTGKSYKIVNASDISNDRTFRNAWTIADDELTDGVGE